MKLNSLVITSKPHKNTGKAYISASFTLNYQEHDVCIDLEDKRVLVSIDDQMFAKVFERSVPLIQVLYHIRTECEKI